MSEDKSADLLRVCDTEQVRLAFYDDWGYRNASAIERTRKVALLFTLPVLTLAGGSLKTCLKKVSVPKSAVAGLHLQ